VAPGGRLDEALADGPDLWWNSLLRLGVIGRGAALAIVASLLTAAAVSFTRVYRLATGNDERSVPAA
jgi:hypothetical protein